MCDKKRGYSPKHVDLPQAPKEMRSMTDRDLFLKKIIYTYSFQLKLTLNPGKVRILLKNI